MPLIRAENKDGPAIGILTLLLLIYADDVVLFAHEIKALQKLVDAIYAFCKDTGLSVNVSKTKYMIVSTLKKENQSTLSYQGQPIEKIDNFRYLGIDIPSNYAWDGGNAQKIELMGGTQSISNLKTCACSKLSNDGRSRISCSTHA